MGDELYYVNMGWNNSMNIIQINWDCKNEQAQSPIQVLTGLDVA